MNRADFAWCLSAILPHVGRNKQTALVGLTVRDGLLFTCATDRYTFGIARIPCQGEEFSVTLPAKEATELMRFVRPAKVAEQSEQVDYVAPLSDLHVAIPDESAVFESNYDSRMLDGLLDLARRIHAGPDDPEHLVFAPDFAARFSKAKRTDTDFLSIHPRRFRYRNGVAVVTVGDDFIGGICGVANCVSTTTIDSFLGESECAA